MQAGSEKRVGDEGCSIVDLTNLARNSKSSSLLNKKCGSLGIALGIDLAALDNLNPGNTVDLFSHILVLFVSQKSEAATLKSLNEGLRSCKLNEIADLIEQKYSLNKLPDASSCPLASPLPTSHSRDVDAPSCNRNAPQSSNLANNTYSVNLDISENNTLLQEGQETSPNHSSTFQGLEKDLSKIRCIESNWVYILLILTIGFMLVAATLLLLVLDKYLVKNDAISNQIEPTHTGCIINSYTNVEDCIIVNASNHSKYSMIMQNYPNEKCVYLNVGEYISTNWPITYELPNAACIYGISLKSVIRQSVLEYFLTKALMIKHLSLDCQESELEHDQKTFKSTTKEIVTLNSLTVDNCDISETLKYVRSYANLVELTSLEIKKVILMSENVMEINNMLLESKNLQQLKVHALYFEASQTEIKLQTKLDSLKEFVFDVESPQDYYDIQPVYLANFCEMTGNVTVLKLALGYLTFDNVRHLYKCTKLTHLEINILLQPDEVDELAIDIHYQQLEKINLNLYFYNCPSYQKFQDLYLDISHQCIKSCTISSNCPVADNGVYSLSC